MQIIRKLLPVIPKNTLSQWVGGFANLPLPGPLNQQTVEWFAKKFQINMDEAELPLSSYKTVGALFTRNLKPGIRPIGPGVVHPVDGRISAWGTVTKGMMIQAKGFDYKIEDFLVSQDWANLFEGGQYFTYYLCPTDYHHIHSPVDGRVVQAHLIPGQLWPVNDWSVSHNKNLFARNERLVSYIETAQGVVALVMVGATVVGKMTVEYDKTLVSNKERQPKMKVYSPARPIQKGERLGTFHMGSTVIMVYPKGFLKLANPNPEGPVKLGEVLGSLG